MVRSYGIAKLPGLQIDEAMAGYDAWSVANFGVDSALNEFPMYLISYGTGQSAVYTYLAIPFIKIMGLTLISIRLPMFIISIISIVLLLFTLFKINAPKKLTISVLFFLSINPWSIMSSRFALDANIAPNLILQAICLLILGAITSGKKRMLLYMCSIALLCITSYAYIASWYFLPIFMSALAYILLKRKLLSFKQLIILGLEVVILIIPIVIFAYVQFFGDTNLTFLWMTIPKLLGTQNEGQTILYSDNLIVAFIENIQKGIDLMVDGVDGAYFSTIGGFGFIYNLAGMALFCLGLRKIWKETDLFSLVIKIWLFSSIPLILIVTPLIHHWNILFFPIIIIASYGLYVLFVHDFQHLGKPISLFFCFVFILFINNYRQNSSIKNGNYIMTVGLEEVVQECSTFDNVFINKNSLVQNSPLEFIYFRFFDPISPYEWQRQRDEPHNSDSNLTSFRYGKYYFYSDIDEIKEISKENSVYIIGNTKAIDLSTYENENYQVKRMKEFTMISK